MTVSWIDIAFAVVLALGTFKGFAIGFVKELGGFVALVAGLIAPWYYNGAADGFIAATFHVGFFAHGIGMLATGIAAYAIVMIAVIAANGIAKLPILGLGNKIAGGAVGFVKAFVFLWIVTFVALFFPLGAQLRADVKRSQLAPFVTAYSNVAVRFLYAAIPPAARVYLQPAFDRHHL
jgi:uncharacterized membrane protein required for colicin V production